MNQLRPFRWLIAASIAVGGLVAASACRQPPEPSWPKIAQLGLEYVVLEERLSDARLAVTGSKINLSTDCRGLVRPGVEPIPIELPTQIGSLQTVLDTGRREAPPAETEWFLRVCASYERLTPPTPRLDFILDARVPADHRLVDRSRGSMTFRPDGPTWVIDEFRQWWG